MKNIPDGKVTKNAPDKKRDVNAPELNPSP